MIEIPLTSLESKVMAAFKPGKSMRASDIYKAMPDERSSDVGGALHTLSSSITTVMDGETFWRRPPLGRTVTRWCTWYRVY